jgi:hypothetical protein
MELHFISLDGSAVGWNIVYYLFASARGVMFFVIIGLIGTGWAFLKPFLADKDKKILLVVIPLQILDNIALIIIEEEAPGSQFFSEWVSSSSSTFKIFECKFTIYLQFFFVEKYLQSG